MLLRQLKKYWFAIVKQPVDRRPVPLSVVEPSPAIMGV